MNLKKNAALICLIVSFSFYYAHSTTDFKSSEATQCLQQPQAKVDVYSIASVGIFSALVFALIGVLPALFIRTDADEARFSRFWRKKR